MIAADFVLKNVSALATLAGPVPRLGAQLKELAVIRDAALAAKAGRIVWVGLQRDVARAVEQSAGAVVFDAEGSAVVPGFVDAHTHLAFAGDRDDEIRQRLAGRSYQAIAAEGGGIVKSVAATRSASREQLALAIAARLDEMLLCGTTTAEV